MLTWNDLAARSLARQFPALTGGDDVAGMLDRVGPIQSQTARSVFIGLAARLPGVTREAITAAYESFAIVRGSSLRGTVHTSAAAAHPLLEVGTRLGQRPLWRRSLRLADATLEQVWEGIEEFAFDAWRTREELAEHLTSWLAANDPGARPSFSGTQGRYFAFGHGGLIRRPLGDDWAGQGLPGYRTASAVLGDRSTLLADADAAVDALLLQHVRAHGPSSRHDLAWWSGLGLTRVDAALARLGLDSQEGPDGRRYADLPDAPAPVELAGVRLLPEFDALLCGYDPAGRERFVDAAHYEVLWKQANGQLLAPVLAGNRLAGYWRLTGSGRRRRLEVVRFPGVRAVGREQLAEAVTALELALDLRLEAVGLD